MQDSQDRMKQNPATYLIEVVASVDYTSLVVRIVAIKLVDQAFGRGRRPAEIVRHGEGMILSSLSGPCHTSKEKRRR